MTTLPDYLAFAHRLADAAAHETLPRFRTALDAEDKNAGDTGVDEFDPVTEADRAAEDIIRILIKETYPAHGMLGEERGEETGTSALTWVIDPIDGTRAFIAGIPLWTTLIALNDGTKPVLGVVDQPYLGERFFGSAEGAFLAARGTRRALRTRKDARLKDAIFSATSPALFRSDAHKRIHAALCENTRLTRYGCDAYAYALLAAGTIDLVVEPDLKPWDVQALIPLVAAAGGAIAALDGGAPQDGGTLIAAANAQLLEECRALIAKA